MMITRYQIESFQDRFKKDYSHFIRQTPLWKLPGKALGVNCGQVWLKLEHLQTGGSFKARCMLNRLLSNPIPASGVIVASGGNAGIATAAAASELGVRCEVFVPVMSSPAKRARLAALGAHVRDALLMTDESIRAAQLWLWKELRLAVEPAAALPLATLHGGRYLPRCDEQVCLIICGANLDPASLN